jgi:hypothetical protein
MNEAMPIPRTAGANAIAEMAIIAVSDSTLFASKTNAVATMPTEAALQISASIKYGTQRGAIHPSRSPPLRGP